MSPGGPRDVASSSRDPRGSSGDAEARGRGPVPSNRRGDDLRSTPACQPEHHAITLDQTLFASLEAPPDLHGPTLLVAIALAQWAILLGPAVLAGLWVAGSAEDRAAAVATAVAATLALAVAGFLSPMIDAPRPFVDGGAVNYLAHVRDGSFPSDHATLAFAIAAGLGLRRPVKARAVWLPLLAVAVAIGWARVFLGAHYPVDILGGAVVGSAAAALTLTPFGRALLRPINALGEQVRARTLAKQRRSAPARSSSGSRDP